MFHFDQSARSSWHLPLLFFLASLATSSVSAQVDELDELDELPQYLPGVIAEYHSAGQSRRQLEADVWLDEPLGRSLEGPWDGTRARESFAGSQRTESAPRRVTWSGYLWARENGPFQLELFTAGRIKVSLAGKQVLDAYCDQPRWLACEPIELRFGYHQLEIDFEPTAAPARLGAYWSGPSFTVESIGSQYLFHSADQTPDDPWEVGQLLSRGLRCAACHATGGNPQQVNKSANSAPNVLSAPALTHLRDNLRPEWLVKQLTQPAPLWPTNSSRSSSHLPAYELDESDAQDIVAALWQASMPSPKLESLEDQLDESNRSRSKKSEAQRTVGDVAQGELAFVSTGCLACHQVGQLGRPSELAQQLFGGGNLTNIAEKRTNVFFRQWLSDPARVNPDHRMPQFDLTPLEQLDLVSYLSSLADTSPNEQTVEQTAEQILATEGNDGNGETQELVGNVEHGALLITALRCNACHQLPESLAANFDIIPLKRDSQWDSGCLAEADPVTHRPGFGLNPSQRNSLREYWNATPAWAHRWQSGEALLQENNCTACHARDDRPGIKQQLSEIVAAVPALAPRLAALAPPSLTAIGDKLHDDALRAAITRRAPLLRPWLDVRMPRYQFSESQLNSLADSLIAHDRIPPRADDAANLADPETEKVLSDAVSQQAATRLVTAEGFGCQSCHAIGAVESPKVDLNARGTNLAMLGERVRPSWFQRWVRNPARIVPRMEMPAIQTPVRGVLHDSLSLQLDALWATLNTPGFTPPRPGPVRVIRTHNDTEINDRAWLLTDVIEANQNAFIRPLGFGLPNRHNFLFDLEAGQLTTWWLGDTAYQYTRGKTWFWAPGAALLTEPEQALERIRIVDAAGRVGTNTVRSNCGAL
ncbi:MAG: c-type cytochrome [Pirellulaceae bacterium]